MTNMAGGLISGVETLMLEVDCPDARLVISQSLLEKLAAPAMKAWQKARGTTLEYTVHAAGLMGLGVRGGQYALQTRIASTPVVDAVVKVLEVHHSMANPWEQQVKFEVRWTEIDGDIARLMADAGEWVIERKMDWDAAFNFNQWSRESIERVEDAMCEALVERLALVRGVGVTRPEELVAVYRDGLRWRPYLYNPLYRPGRCLVRIAKFEPPMLLDIEPTLRVTLAWRMEEEK